MKSLLFIVIGGYFLIATLATLETGKLIAQQSSMNVTKLHLAINE